MPYDLPDLALHHPTWAAASPPPHPAFTCPANWWVPPSRAQAPPDCLRPQSPQAALPSAWVQEAADSDHRVPLQRMRPNCVPGALVGARPPVHKQGAAAVARWCPADMLQVSTGNDGCSSGSGNGGFSDGQVGGRQAHGAGARMSLQHLWQWQQQLAGGAVVSVVARGTAQPCWAANPTLSRIFIEEF